MEYYKEGGRRSSHSETLNQSLRRLAATIAREQTIYGWAGQLCHNRAFGSWQRRAGLIKIRLVLIMASPPDAVSLRPLGARSSHWYMPQRPSSPRA